MEPHNLIPAKPEKFIIEDVCDVYNTTEDSMAVFLDRLDKSLKDIIVY